MASQNIIQLTNLNGTNASANWSFIAAPSALNENSNPAFNRTVVLSGTGLYIARGTSSVGIPLESIMLFAANVNPALTWPPNFATAPANAYVGYGNTTAVSFPSVAQDEVGTDISYQWQYGSNGANISAAGVFSNVTTNHLNISNTNGLINSSYQLLIVNPSGNNTSNQVYIGYDPLITTQPANQSAVHPASAYFTVVATGQTALSYQWQANGSNITVAGAALYANYTTSNLNVGNSTGLNTTNYRVIVSDTAGVQNSNNATLTVT